MREIRIEDYIDILSGYAFASKKFNSDGIGLPIIRIRDVGQANSETYFDGDYDEKYLIKKGAMLIGMDGDFRLAKWKGNPSLLNQRVCRIRSNSEALLDDYLYYALPIKLKKIEDATSFVTVKHLSVKKINAIEIPLPTLKEQKAIVAKLDRAQRLIDIDKAMLEKYDQLIQSVFLEMFGDPVTNPKGWEVKRFDDLVADDCPLTYGIVQPGDEVINGVPCVRPVDLTQQFISVKGIKRISPEISSKYARTLLKGGEILLSVRGSVGEISIADHTLQDANVTRGIVPIWFDKSISSKLFFYYLYKTKRIQEKIKSLSRGATLVQLNLKELRSLELIAPPISKQHEFEKYAKEVNIQWTQSDLSLAKSEELFSSLVQEVFG